MVPNMTSYTTNTNYNPAMFSNNDQLSSNFNSTNGASTGYRIDDTSQNQLLMAAFGAATVHHDTQPSPTVNITVPTNRWVKN